MDDYAVNITSYDLLIAALSIPPSHIYDFVLLSPLAAVMSVASLIYGSKLVPGILM